MGKKIILLVMMLSFISSNCYAWLDPPTVKDIGLEAAYATVHIMDWGQTRFISNNPYEHSEKNPILGKHPSKDSVDLYFVTTLGLHALATYVLPADYRWIWQTITIGFETRTVVRNFGMGCKIDF